MTDLKQKRRQLIIRKGVAEIPADYGIHDGSVREVIAFALRLEPLSTCGPAQETDDCFIVNDVSFAANASCQDDANAVAISAEFNAATFVLDPDDGLQVFWCDLFALLSRKCYAYRKEQAPLADAIYMQLIESGFPDVLDAALVERGVDESAAAGLANDIASVLLQCARNRAFNGPTDNFLERVFALMQKGLFPCGWHGIYPAGKLIAFRPAD